MISVSQSVVLDDEWLDVLGKSAPFLCQCLFIALPVVKSLETKPITLLHGLLGLGTAELLQWPGRWVAEIQKAQITNWLFIVEQVSIVDFRVGSFLPLDRVEVIEFLVKLASFNKVDHGVFLRVEACFLLRGADGNVDNDLAFIINDLHALLDSWYNIDIIDGATVHEDSVFVQLRWEHAWNRARSKGGLMKLRPVGVSLVKGREFTIINITRRKCHSSLVSLRELLECFIQERQSWWVIKASMLRQAPLDKALSAPGLPYCFIVERGPCFWEELGALCELFWAEACDTRSVDGASGDAGSHVVVIVRFSLTVFSQSPKDSSLPSAQICATTED